MVTTGNLDVGGSGRIDSSLVVGDTMKAQDIVVSGNAKIAGDINLGGGVFFKNGTGISVSTGSALTNEIYSYGKSGTGTSPPINTCFNPSPPWQIHQFGGGFQVYDNGPSGYTGGSIMSLQSWNNASSIDIAGGGGLLMNYFCGKDIIMCTGTNGGIVFVGDKFQARKNVQIGQHYTPVDPNVALNMYDITNDGIKLWPAGQTVKLLHDHLDQFTFWGNGNAHLGNNVQIGFPANTAIQDVNTSLNINNAGLHGIKFNTYNNAGKMFSIDNVNYTTYSPFVIYGDGNAQMGQAIQIGMTQSTLKTLAINLNISSANTTSAIVINDGTKDVFTVLKNGKTCIGCGNSGSFMLAVEGTMGAREIKVTMQNPWPDYVFEKNYDLIPLLKVDDYIKSNKHLPGIPSAKELQKKEFGLNLAEMQGLQMEKIENIYLYLIDLKKEIDSLKKENSELKRLFVK